MRSRRVLVMIAVGVCALLAASLPLRPVEPDGDASHQALLRILDDGNWELWHGPTRFRRARVAISPVAMQTQGQPNTVPALQALSDALADLRLEVRVAGQRALTGLRVEVAPLQPAQVLVQVVLAANGLGLQQFELSADGRRDSIAIGVLPRDSTFMVDETERHAHSIMLDEQGGQIAVVLQVHTTTWEQDANQPHDFEESTETDRLLDWSTPLNADGRMAQNPEALVDVLTGVEHGLHRPRRITLSVVPGETRTLPCRAVVDLLQIITEQTPHQIDLTGFSLLRFEWTR